MPFINFLACNTYLRANTYVMQFEEWNVCWCCWIYQSEQRLHWSPKEFNWLWQPYFMFVAAVFCTVYYASWRCAPMLTPSVHLAVWSSFQQSLYMGVTEAVCGTHIPRTMRIRPSKRTDNMKPYARVTHLKAQLSLVNWCAIWMFCVYNAICYGVNNECSRVQCNMLWCAQWLFVCTARYAMVCTMNVCMYHTICYGVHNECLCVPHDMLWCAQWMFVCTTRYAMVCTMNVCMYHKICFGVKMNVCMYHAICFGVKMNVCMCHACLMYCHELAETIVPTLRHARIAKNCNWNWA